EVLHGGVFGEGREDSRKLGTRLSLREPTAQEAQNFGRPAARGQDVERRLLERRARGVQARRDLLAREAPALHLVERDERALADGQARLGEPGERRLALGD